MNVDELIELLRALARHEHSDVSIAEDAADALEADRKRRGVPDDGANLWLWKNGDHYLAFEHEYPCYEPAGDPMTLGEPDAKALFIKSHDRVAAPQQADRVHELEKEVCLWKGRANQLAFPGDGQAMSDYWLEVDALILRNQEATPEDMKGE